MPKFQRGRSSSSTITREQRREQRLAKRNGRSGISGVGEEIFKPSLSAVRNESIQTGPIQYKTDKQKTYHQMILSHTLTVGTGPAGTGKSHIAVTTAAILLLEKKISKIVICRPAIESGRGLGFLPGEIEEKWAPYFKPVRAILEKRLGSSHVDNMLKNGQIEIAPLEFLRGNTFENAFVILDEAQNATKKEMLTFLTRIGNNCTVVVDGDVQQVDIREPSGLVDMINRLRGMQDYAVCEFDESEIVRAALVRDVIIRYRE
jgi:phosphate starvation-inducible PhoH-like protein